MKVGIQTRPWGVEMNSRELPQVLAGVAAAGYDGIEIATRYLDPDHPEALLALLKPHGLAVAGTHVGAKMWDKAEAESLLGRADKLAAYCAAVGAPFLPLSVPPRPGKTAEEYASEAAAINELGAICRGHGITLCYHNHNWEIENQRRGLAYLCEHTDASRVSLCLDVAWVWRAGDSPVAVAEAFASRIAYYHFKDSTASEWKELGRGNVPVADVSKLLPATGMPWLVVEQDETTLAPVESARVSRQYLASLKL